MVLISKPLIMNEKKKKGSQKTFAGKRSMNVPQGQGNMGNTKAFQEHDTARRLGSFEGRGNHARTGNRGHQ
jgi:hypothetical protein